MLDRRAELDQLREKLHRDMTSVGNISGLSKTIEECSTALNDMSDALIRFTVSWTAIKKHLQTEDQDLTLFDEEKT